MLFGPVLLDSGPLAAYYSARDPRHRDVRDFFSGAMCQFVTSEACAAEVMHLLKKDWRVQNEFLLDIARSLYICEHMSVSDYARIAELNSQYADRPADFADLSLIVISERLNISAIASFDADFDIYRRFRKKTFRRVFR